MIKKSYINEELIIEALTAFKKDPEKNIFAFNKGSSKLRIVKTPTENDLVLFGQKFEGETFYFCFV